jgi:hypothetical protein
MLQRSHESACETSPFGPRVLFPQRVEAEMLAMKAGYLATGLAFLFVGAITMGLF